MEKQRSKSKSESFRRLLIAIIFFTFSFSSTAQTLTYAIIKDLRISPSADQKLYVGSDIKFEVIIPYVKSANVDVTFPEEQNNVSFKTLRRTEELGANATKLELWFNFGKKGTYQLKPLEVKIKNVKRQISFNPVQVSLNPKDQQPMASVIFSDNRVINADNLPDKNPAFAVKAGDKIRFTINVQYTTQLTQFNWDIPKDSIFIQGQTYEITEVKYRERVITDDYIPVSDFEWTPLVPGEVSFPEFYLTATSYTGSKFNIRLPSFTILVEKGSSHKGTDGKNYFNQAFDSYIADSKFQVKDVSLEDCETLAALRSLEKHQLFGRARRTRIELEQSLGLPAVQKENSVIPVYIYIVFIVLFVFMIVIFIKRKMTIAAVCGAVLIICSAVLLIVSAVQAEKQYGICTGCTVYSIPDSKAEVTTELPAGNRVQVVEKAGNWIFIQLGETGGWCSINDVILIK